MPFDVAGSGGQRSGRSVTSKVVALLDAFSVSRPELSLNELSRRTGLPLSTTYRLAGELVEWGGLERVEGGGYRIGPRLLEVGALAPRGANLHDVVLPFLQDLYVATREDVHLAVRQGLEALYVARVTGRGAVSVTSRQWGRVPLHATGVGKVLLAYAPEPVVDEVIAAGLRRYTPNTIVAPVPLRRNLAEIRRAGVAFAREEMTVGRVSVAAPIVDASGATVAAVSIVLPATGPDAQRLAPAVRTAALCASRELREWPVRPQRITGVRRRDSRSP